MKTYNYVLLDWDGTVAHTLDLWPDALDTVLRKRGYNLSRKQLIESTWGFVDYVMQTVGLTAQEANRALKEANEIVISKSSSIELFPDALDVLSELKAAGKHLAIVTTSERNMVLPALERLGIVDLFETIITDDDIDKIDRKPSPIPLLLALKQMRGTPSESIMIGDRDKDIVAAHNAQMDSVLFCSFEHQQHYDKEKLLEYKPTFAIDNFRDLLKLM